MIMISSDFDLTFGISYPGCIISRKKNILYVFLSNVYFSPVSQRCDHQSFSATKKFILVDKIHVSNLDMTLIKIFLEVESALFQPFKVGNTFDVHLHLMRTYILCVSCTYAQTIQHGKRHYNIGNDVIDCRLLQLHCHFAQYKLEYTSDLHIL